MMMITIIIITHNNYYYCAGRGLQALLFPQLVYVRPSPTPLLFALSLSVPPPCDAIIARRRCPFPPARVNPVRRAGSGGGAEDVSAGRGLRHLRPSASIRPGRGPTEPSAARSALGSALGPPRGDGGARVSDGASEPRPPAAGGGEDWGGRAGAGPAGEPGPGVCAARLGRREERCAGPRAGLLCSSRGPLAHGRCSGATACGSACAAPRPPHSWAQRP